MFTTDFSSSEPLLTNKECRHFAESEVAFRAWSEAEGRTAQQVQQAITEINAYVAEQEKEIDEQLARQRDEATEVATIEAVNRQVQEQFVHENPWFPLEPQVREVNAKILWERTLAVAQGEGTDLYPHDMSDEALEAFGNTIMRLLRKAAQQLWNERRFYGIDFSEPHVHTPFSIFIPNTDPALEPVQQYTNEQIESALDAGEISMEDLKNMADYQLAKEAEQRGEGVRQDTEMAISNRRPAPEHSAPQNDMPSVAQRMFGTNVDRRRG